MKLLSLLLLMACSSQVSYREPSSSSSHNGWQQIVLRQNVDFPDSEYLGGWQPNRDFVMERSVHPNDISQKEFNCTQKKLYPTHPSQMTKEYLHAVSARYDHGRLPPNSYACLTKNPTNRFCLRATWAIMAVMSDTYEDNCGNFYRGYWLVSFLKSDESMGTLFAKGRIAYEKPNAQFANEYVEGGTYLIKPQEFLFLGELLPGDQNKIRAEKQRALRSGFRMNGKLFVK